MFRIIAGICLALAVTIPIYFMAPPLASDTASKAVLPAIVRYLSESGVAGFTAFGQNCASCHGQTGKGSDKAPSLINRAYAADFRDSAIFHEQLEQAVEAHRDVVLARRNKGKLRFNEVELMSKFLRESRKYEQRRAQEGW